jgi:hypothetical protein
MITSEQEAAIDTNERFCVVRAGAGSGKTKVITHRVAELVDRGAWPGSIVVATFSRAAANEMRERLGKLASQVHVGTFHSIILKVMEDVGEKPAVLSDKEADKLLEDCCLTAGVAVRTKGSVRWLKGSLSQWRKKVDGREPSQVLSIYLSRLAIGGDIDYSGIIHRGIQLATQGVMNPKHVIVDEAQDNDALQWRLIEILSQSASVFVVGDVNQTIYCWRGAKPERMDIGWPSYPLTETFRCAQNIVEFVNKIENISVKLRTNIPGGIVKLGGDAVELVKQAATRYPYDDIAVLCRYNSTAAQLAAQLSSFAHAGHCKALERGPLYHVLRYLSSPNSTVAREYARKAVEGSTSGLSVITQLLASAKPVKTLAPLIMSDIAIHGDNPVKLADRVFAGQAATLFPGEYSWLRHYYSHETLDFFRREECGTLTKPTTSGITVGTIHSAKGLEWPCVVVVTEGMRNRLEDHRLFYVATTRAKESLLLPGDTWKMFLEKESENGLPSTP